MVKIFQYNSATTKIYVSLKVMKCDQNKGNDVLGKKISIVPKLI